ncbi:MAG: ABC transporter permease [Pseudobdellovibrionaceae bacterium]
MSFLQKAVIFPRINSLCFKVWKRNFLYFRKTIVVSILWVAWEPTLYLVALGYGLGAYVTQMNGISYVEFLFPGLLCLTAMLGSFFEATYGTFHKLTMQKTFNTMLMTPVGTNEIIFGEILWCASKGFLGVLGVTLVGGLFGLVTTWHILPVLFFLFVICWMFAAMGMLVTSVAKNYDSFIYSTSGFITPMTMLSGIYFPLEQSTSSVQLVTYILPLRYANELIRQAFVGNYNVKLFLFFFVIICIGYLCQNLAMYRIRRKLIK